MSIAGQNGVALNGVARQFELLPIGRDGLFSLLLDGVSRDVFIEQIGSDFTASIGGTRYQVHLEDEKTRLLQRVIKIDETVSRRLAVRAPMPGLVTKINVAAGDKIEKGCPLLIIEAMKMENEIRAASAGIVQSVTVSERASVEKGAVMLVIE